jgi:mannose-6-phosphate isomerase
VTAVSDLYPLLFEPNLSERPWGGRKLETVFHKPLPPGDLIGESWEIFTTNVIANGALKGRTLREALATLGERLGPRDGDDFPLLVKFLDARDWLSVQVHPDDRLAREIENLPRGKTECWYILEAEPGARLAYGVNRAMSADEFRAAVVAGKAHEMMSYLPVKAGDFVFVPARTAHAIGPGILLYELQQSSDTTYRVYDWDRVGKDGQPRELHLEKALRVTDFQPPLLGTLPYTVGTDPNGNQIAEIFRGEFFIEGRVEVHGVVLEKGRSALIPAALGAYTLRQSSGAVILQGWLVGP